MGEHVPPLKILQIAHSYAPERNGIAEVVRRLAEGLARRGHDVNVATSASADRRPGPIDGVTVRSFPIQGNWVTGVRGAAAAQRDYIDFVADPSWDVRSFHAGQIWTLDLLLDQIPELSGVNVYTPHGVPGLESPQWREYYARMPHIFASFDQVVCLSDIFEEKPYADSIGLSNASVIPNGVDIEEFSHASIGVQQDWKVGSDRPWLLNVSNHAPQKSHDRLIDLARALPDVDVVNIGNGYPAARWNLGRYGVKGGCYYRCNARALRVPGLHLRFNVPRPTIVSALHEADLFLLTSQWEASPLVILEAMAAGLPWVSLDVGNVREHAGGMVVDDMDDMADTVRRLLADPDLRADLSRAGRRRIQERHSWESIVNSYENLYYSLQRERTV